MEVFAPSQHDWLDFLSSADDLKPTTWGDERTELKGLWKSVQDDDEELLLFFPGGHGDFKC